MMDSPKKLDYRMPAEYEPHHGLLMIWPSDQGLGHFRVRLQKAFSQIIKTIAQGKQSTLLG